MILETRSYLTPAVLHGQPSSPQLHISLSVSVSLVTVSLWSLSEDNSSVREIGIFRLSFAFSFSSSFLISD